MIGIKNKLNDVTVMILRPLVRILLAQGMTYGEFSNTARRVFVSVAEKNFLIPGKKQSDSRISVITGINRKDVHRCRAITEEAEEPLQNNFNRVERVIHGWLKDADYIDEKGKPRILSHAKELDEFAALIKRYSGDMPARAMLDEMVRIAAVEKLVDQQVRLCVSAYVPQHSIEEKLPLLARSTSDLLNTIGHNLEHQGKESKLQLNVEYHRLYPELAKEFKQFSEKKSFELLQELNQWLAVQSKAEEQENSSNITVRAGLGIYFFDEIQQQNFKDDE